MKQLFRFLTLLFIPLSLYSYTSLRVVVIRGEKFKNFYGRKLSSLRVYRCEKNVPVAIPFQWDEKDERGNFIFKNAPGTLSPDDELLFLFRDAGERGGEECRKRAEAEIKVTNWKGTSRYVYLMCCQGESLAGIPADYVRVRDGGMITMGKTYMIRFFREYQSVPGEYVYIGGKRPVHFMDKVKLRSSLRFFHFFHIEKNETDFVTKWEGTIDGRVRAVLGLKNYTKMAFNIPAFPIYADVEVFPDYMRFPIKVDIPVVPDSFKIKLVDDFHNLYGWKIYSSCSKKPYVVKGNPRGSGNFICDRWKWYALSGPDFSYWTISILPENFPVRIGFYLKDDRNYSSPPERFRGEVPGLGWDIESLSEIKNKVKEIDLVIYHIFAPPYQPGMEKELINDIIGKLNVRVTYLHQR